MNTQKDRTMTTVRDFTVGQRVQLHPATNLWMRGAKFGEVVRVTTFYVYVKVDAIGRTYRFAPGNLLAEQETGQ